MEAAVVVVEAAVVVVVEAVVVVVMEAAARHLLPLHDRTLEGVPLRRDEESQTVDQLAPRRVRRHHHGERRRREAGGGMPIRGCAAVTPAGAQAPPLTPGG